MKKPPAQRTQAVAHEDFSPHVAGINYGVLDGLLGYAVRRVQIVLTNRFVRELLPWRITPQRFSALVLIANNPHLRVTELTSIMGIARPGAISIVHDLVAMNYVSRVPCASDGRVSELVLTDLGRRDLPQIEAVVLKQDDMALGKLTSAERHQLTKLLNKMVS